MRESDGIHNYFFNIPELPWKEGRDASSNGKGTKKTGKEKGSKRKTRKRLRIWDDEENWVDA
jgi:hypothetical protein